MLFTIEFSSITFIASSEILKKFKAAIFKLRAPATITACAQGDLIVRIMTHYPGLTKVCACESPYLLY